MALVDFTNPQAVKWYQGRLKKLLEMGVDCFKTDFAELIPTDVAYHDGSDPQLMHNFYAYLYNKTVFDLLEDYHGRGNAVLFARAATAGSQKFPVHWGGDCFATFESMAEDLRGGLSFCMSGPAFWSHDIGGFEGTANPACYKRWVAFGLLSTHSRLHGSGSYRVPWIFDEEAVDVMRHFVKLKNRLFPYLFAAAHDANEKGLPAMRAMPLEFADDPACRYLDRQYLLGGSLLVAPIFNAAGMAEYYVPAGAWTDVQTGKSVAGGEWKRHKCDFFQIPLLVRENTLLPMSRNEASPEWKASDPLDLHVYELADGAQASIRLVPTDGGEPVSFQAKRKGSQITLQAENAKGEVKVFVHGRDFGKPVEAAWKKGARKVDIRLGD
jgi:alpha-D-xyloside xylohydrolase